MLRGGSGLPPPPAPRTPVTFPGLTCTCAGRDRAASLLEMGQDPACPGPHRAAAPLLRDAPSAAGGARLTPSSPSSEPAALGMPLESCVALPPPHAALPAGMPEQRRPSVCIHRPGFPGALGLQQPLKGLEKPGTQGMSVAAESWARAQAGKGAVSPAVSAPAACSC